MKGFDRASSSRARSLSNAVAYGRPYGRGLSRANSVDTCENRLARFGNKHRERLRKPSTRDESWVSPIGSFSARLVWQTDHPTDLRSTFSGPLPIGHDGTCFDHWIDWYLE